MLRKQRLVRGAAAVVGLLVLPLAAGCSGGDGAKSDGKAAKATAVPDAEQAAVVAPAKVEVIADLTGCKVKIRVDADELREGVCHTPKGDYLITTFPKEKFKLTWLDTASIYGGKYLVGPRWAITAKPKLLEPLRKKVGGSIQSVGNGNATPPTAP
ncbi:hypothetical protein [Streptomyces sp. NPDC046862]|uniref:hypothetical protein n=1 Tax=Streptomyces sp. NPDC046862 TaxID=3154603 RepID=UPI003455D623